MNAVRQYVCLLGLFTLLSGCIGVTLPNVSDIAKPLSLFRGESLGKDQLANRLLVAKGIVPIRGTSSNDLLTLLGQPQSIYVTEKKVSEEWLFVYYKRYKTWPKTDSAAFIVRLYHDQVTEIINDPNFIPPAR